MTSPKKIPSPVRSEGSCSTRPPRSSGTAAATFARSAEFVSRKGQQGAALAQYGAVDFGWALGHEHQADAVFSAFLCDQGERAVRGCLAALGHKSVSLVEHNKEGLMASADRQVLRPEQHVIYHAEHGPNNGGKNF